MSNNVLLKRSSVQGKIPTTASLQLGELALNTYDGNLFFKKSPNGTDSLISVSTNGNLLSYITVTANTTAVARQSYIANTSGGAFTITLPASPNSGDWVVIADGSNFSTTPLTVARNSQTIDGIAQDLNLDIQGVSVTLTFNGTTWLVYTQVGASGGNGSGVVDWSNITNKPTIPTVPTVLSAFTNDSGYITASGNAATATKLATARNINGVAFDGSAAITIAAAATTLTGTSLNSTVVSSSLTSVGTLTKLSIAAGGISTNGITVGSTGNLFDDGNFHIHSTAGSLWLNATDGSTVNLNTQTSGGVNLGGVTSMNSGYGSVAPVYGVRAWINCGWNGSSMTTRASGNLSVSRSSAGVYTFTFGTAMPDGNYAITATAQTPGSNSDCAVNITNGTTPSTTGFSLTVARYGNGNEDTPILHVQVVR
jgi:hypothetical protein